MKHDYDEVGDWEVKISAIDADGDPMLGHFQVMNTLRSKASNAALEAFEKDLAATEGSRSNETIGEIRSIMIKRIRATVL